MTDRERLTFKWADESAKFYGLDKLPVDMLLSVECSVALLSEEEVNEFLSI